MVFISRRPNSVVTALIGQLNDLQATHYAIYNILIEYRNSRVTASASRLIG